MPSARNSSTLKDDQTATFNRVLREELKTIRDMEQDEASVVAAAHQARLAGLAFSGGGIRSATFNLGVLQALAKMKLLDKFDYLSTVSGGGYIGSWLAAWIQRQGKRTRLERAVKSKVDLTGLASVMATLGRSNGHRQEKEQETPAEAGKSRAEPKTIAHLRKYSNYLTPKKGLWSTDTCTLAAAYLRNLLLTMSILVGVLTAVLLIGRGALILNALLLGVGSNVFGDWLYWICGMGLAGISFFTARDLNRCRTGLNKSGDNSKLASRMSVTLMVIAVWMVTVLLWRQRNAFLGEGLISNTIAAYAVQLALIFSGGLLGNFFITEGGRQELDPPYVWFRFKRLLASGGGATIFFFSLWAVCHWFKSWPGNPPWRAVAGGPALTLALMTLFAVTFIGLGGRDFKELEREWLARLFAAATKWTLLICVLFAALIGVPVALKWLGSKWDGYPTGLLTGLWVVISTIGPWMLRAGQDSGSSSGRWIRKAVTGVAPAVFIVGLLAILIAALESTAVNTWLFGRASVRMDDIYRQVAPELSVTAAGRCLGAGSVLLLLTLVWSWRVGVNTFSLHALYGNRLIRAYLGASNPNRHSHAFTDFDPDDNQVRMSDLIPSCEGYRGPYLLINAAINLAHSRRLAWQQRKAGAFLFSPLYCGYEFPPDTTREEGAARDDLGGYVPSRWYADGKRSRSGISLGKAMTISGAAASPNMGHRTTPAVAFLMTVFNIRLGWWLPNTAKGDAKLWRKEGPGLGLLYLVQELLGLTNAGRKFIYLSDGGHFENLGLYELVRRRCRYIVVVDAEEDAEMRFEGLGTAVERCRLDFGIPIDIDVGPLKSDKTTGFSRQHCAVGRIRYSKGYAQGDQDQPDGTLFYIKATRTGKEPQDIDSYAAGHPNFPHESTADQWFDERQFESYRVLGRHIMSAAVKEAVEQTKSSIPDEKQAGEAVEVRRAFLEKLFRELTARWISTEDPTARPVESEAAPTGAQQPLVGRLALSPMGDSDWIFNGIFTPVGQPDNNMDESEEPVRRPTRRKKSPAAQPA